MSLWPQVKAKGIAANSCTGVNVEQEVVANKKADVFSGSDLQLRSASLGLKMAKIFRVKDDQKDVFAAAGGYRQSLTSSDGKKCFQRAGCE